MAERRDESNRAPGEQQIAISRDAQGRIVQIIECVPSRLEWMTFRDDAHIAVQELLIAQKAFEASVENSGGDLAVRFGIVLANGES